jgi:hypothetical protein
MQPAVIQISFDMATGQLGVNSNVPNLVIALGMLDMAKAQMIEQVKKNQERSGGIELAPPGLEVARNGK